MGRARRRSAGWSDLGCGARDWGRAALRGRRCGHWATPQMHDTTFARVEDVAHTLNPFDPLVIQRKRLALFFGYEHRFEAYVPKEKRLFGYFSQPVLVGDEIVAVLDLKTDGERQKLLVQQWTWLAKSGGGRRRKQIEEALDRFERFQLAR